MSTLAHKNLKSSYRGLRGFRPVFSPDGLNNTLLSKVCVLEMAPSSGIMGRTYILKTSLGSRASDCPGLILGSSALICLRELPKFSPCVLSLGVHTLVYSAYSIRTYWQPIGYHRNDTAAFLWACGFENASFYLAFSWTTCSEENQVPCHEPYGEIEVSCQQNIHLPTMRVN